MAKNAPQGRITSICSPLFMAYHHFSISLHIGRYVSHALLTQVSSCVADISYAFRIGLIRLEICSSLIFKDHMKW